MAQLNIKRLDQHLRNHREIKDTTIFHVPGDGYYKIASIGCSVKQAWLMGRFHADRPEGPWQELAPVSLTGLAGKEVCAPKVIYEIVDGKPLWTMYVQEKCFSMGGNIAVATSNDGINFRYDKKSSLPLSHVQNYFPNVGCLYDVSLADVNLKGFDYDLIIFSGYRDDYQHANPDRRGFVGCGDIYGILRRKGAPRTVWEKPFLMLEQESIKGHNHPYSPEFEWGAEGAEVIQLAPNLFILMHVYFKENGQSGERQDNMLWAATNPRGPWAQIGPLLDTFATPLKQGENGHSGVIKADGDIHIVYQQRDGDGKPWYQCHIAIPEKNLMRCAMDAFEREFGRRSEKAAHRVPALFSLELAPV